MKTVKVFIILSFIASLLMFIFTDIMLVSKFKHHKILSNNANKLTSQSFNNIKTFAALFETMNVPVFLLDPPILESMSNNSRDTATKCKYLCVIHTNMALGILGPQWIPKDDLLGKLHKEGFDITVTDHHTQQSNVDSLLVPEVPTHYMFQRGGHTLHLVVFYERESGFWWHGPLYEKVKSGDTDDLAIDLTKLKFGKFAGAYDKIDVRKVTMDKVQLYVPKYPTHFLKQVPHARFIECNHTRASIFYTRNRKDVGRKAMLFRKTAQKLLSHARRTLDELEIPFWMSSGTCLGWYRECDIIPYSRDVDISISIKDNDVRLIPALQKSGLHLKYLYGKPSDSYGFAFVNEGVKLDVSFTYEATDHMWEGATHLRIGKKSKYLFPKFTLCWTEFLDMKIRIPCETQSYVEAMYGLNWFIPAKKWNWRTSARNMQENGKWAKDEWPKVMQEFS